MSAFARGFRLSTELVAGVLVGAGLGWLLDRWLGTTPWGLMVFLLLGFAAGVLERDARGRGRRRETLERLIDGVMDPIHQFQIINLFPLGKLGNAEIAFTNSAAFMAAGGGAADRLPGASARPAAGRCRGACNRRPN